MWTNGETSIPRNIPCVCFEGNMGTTTTTRMDRWKPQSGESLLESEHANKSVPLCDDYDEHKRAMSIKMLCSWSSVKIIWPHTVKLLPYLWNLTHGLQLKINPLNTETQEEWSTERRNGADTCIPQARVEGGIWLGVGSMHTRPAGRPAASLRQHFPVRCVIWHASCSITWRGRLLTTSIIDTPPMASEKSLRLFPLAYPIFILVFQLRAGSSGLI
jgi:hypothetical protein